MNRHQTNALLADLGVNHTFLIISSLENLIVYANRCHRTECAFLRWNVYVFHDSINVAVLSKATVCRQVHKLFISKLHENARAF